MTADEASVTGSIARLEPEITNISQSLNDLERRTTINTGRFNSSTFQLNTVAV